MKTWGKVFLVLVFAGVTASCGTRGSGSKTVEAPAAAIEVPRFSGDSAYGFVARQVAFGSRVPNTDAHLACAGYLSDALRRFGATVVVQKATVKAFDGTLLHIQNIIGQYQPEKRNRVLLFAHWDSRPFADHDPDPSRRNQPISGANDGASGVGALLEIARHLGAHPTQVGVDIVFFDAEDYGTPDHIEVAYQPDTWCLGSQYWGRNPHLPGYEARYGILLDMVGARNASFYFEGYSMQFAPRLVKRIWQTASDLGFGHHFIAEQGATITDDHVYVNQLRGIPCVDIIQHDPSTPHSFGTYWHTHADDLDGVDAQTLSAVGQTVMQVIYHEK